MAVEMKEMIVFDMGEDSLENRLNESKAKLFSLVNQRSWSYSNGGQTSMFITCKMSHGIPF